MNNLIAQHKTAAFVVMTPALGERLLAMNTHNRSCGNNYVKNLKHAIQCGEWVATNQGIAVSRTGVLLDGQHRLFALKEAGWPAVEILLVTGLPDEVQSAIDQGKKRTVGDALKLSMGVTLSTTLVGALNVILKDRADWNRHLKFTVEQFGAVYNEFAEQIPMVVRVNNEFSSPITAAFMVAAKRPDVSTELMSAIIDEFLSGVGLEKGNPMLTLREWCLRFARGGGVEVQEERFKKATKALNFRIAGQKLAKLYA